MKIRLISTKIVKPSSPTPNHLKTHKLSLLDQLVPDIYFSVVLFYAGESRIISPTKISDHLRKSLSETLTHFYPLAGQVKDEFSVDCNDYGAIFNESHADNQMSEILNRPELHLLEQLLPEKLSTQVNLAVQVSYFNCGGMAISFCFRHIIADATTAANFIKTWARVSSGFSDDIDQHVSFDCAGAASIFPTQELLGFSKDVLSKRCSSIQVISKGFRFDGDKIATLRDEINIGFGPCSYRPTSFEAVSALILGAVIAAATRNTHFVAIIPVNLRKKMNPPLMSQQCMHMGNICTVTIANLLMEKTIEYKYLVEKVHESIEMMNENYASMFQNEGGFLNYSRNINEEYLSNGKFRSFTVNSWCRLPFYEADFGWGKPKWVVTAGRDKDIATFFDTKDGKGIEAWVALSKEDMAKFQQDPNILAYASFNPTI